MATRFFFAAVGCLQSSLAVKQCETIDIQSLGCFMFSIDSDSCGVARATLEKNQSLRAEKSKAQSRDDLTFI
jgi:hypothetical protein